ADSGRSVHADPEREQQAQRGDQAADQGGSDGVCGERAGGMRGGGCGAVCGGSEGNYLCAGEDGRQRRAGGTAAGSAALRVQDIPGEGDEGGGETWREDCRYFAAGSDWRTRERVREDRAGEARGGGAAGDEILKETPVKVKLAGVAAVLLLAG